MSELIEQTQCWNRTGLSKLRELANFPDVFLAFGRSEALAEALEPVLLRSGVPRTGGNAVVVLKDATPSAGISFGW